MLLDITKWWTSVSTIQEFETWDNRTCGGVLWRLL
jgi:hypothetical protein